MTAVALSFPNTLRRLAIDFVAKPASPRPLAALRIGLAAALLCQAFAFSGSLLDLYGQRGIVQWDALPFGPPPEMPSLGGIRSLLQVSPDTSVRIVFYVYVASLVCLLV